MKFEVPDWRGRTVVCIASGPSLTEDACATVHASGHPVIVTNTTFRRAPWADVLLGFDLRWWKEYADEVRKAFPGIKVSASQHVGKYGVQTLHGEAWASGFHNSGATAILVAAQAGARKVVLLGYDCQRIAGRAHWHADHPPTMTNAESISSWPRMFDRLAKVLGRSHSCEVVNCSPGTALTCFRRSELKDEL